MCKIVQPDDINSEEINHLNDDVPSDTGNNFRPVIPVSRESNQPIIEWTDNDTLLRGAFPDLFMFGQGIPKRITNSPKLETFCIVL